MTRELFLQPKLFQFFLGNRTRNYQSYMLSNEPGKCNILDTEVAVILHHAIASSARQNA